MYSGQRKNRKTYQIMLSVLAALAMLAALVFAAPGKVFADDTGTGTLAIKEQPKSAEVSYPDGATFHVEVDHPENVESYEWTYTVAGTVFLLDGTSASTDTLIIPSTRQDDNLATIQCKITDKQGKTYTTNSATLTVKNGNENKSVLYVGDYAVEPGEVLDLAETGLGRGTVTFDAGGVNLTFENFVFDNTNMTFDHTVAPALGLCFIRRNPDQSEYHFDFRGTCSITNTFFDEDYNSGGVTFQAFFACGEAVNRPRIVIGGDGDLSIKGGGNQIYTDADIEIAADLKTDVPNKNFCDGIRAGNIFVDEGVHLQMNVNGTALHAEGDLRVYDSARVNIRSLAPHVGVGPTSKNIMFIGGSLYAKNSGINIIGIADPENFIPYESALASFSGIMLAGEGNLNLDATMIYIDLSMIYAGEQFAMNFAGIVGQGETNAISLENGASIDINMNDPEVMMAVGILMPGIIEVNPGSAISINVLSSGEATGMEVGDLLAVDDGQVETSVSSADDAMTFGIVSGAVSIHLTDRIYYVHSKVDAGGIAIAADTGARGGMPAYDHSYKPVKIQLLGKADCVEPERNDISLYGVPGDGDTIVAETFFNTSGDEVPATEVLIGIGNSLIWLYCVIAGLIILALIIFFLIRGHRQKLADARAEAAAQETAQETEKPAAPETGEEAVPEAGEDTAPETGEDAASESVEDAAEQPPRKVITVDTSKCLQCGMCIKECQAGVLAFDYQKVPAFMEGGGEKCVGCRNCETICPADALHVEG